MDRGDGGVLGLRTAPRVLGVQRQGPARSARCWLAALTPQLLLLPNVADRCSGWLHQIETRPECDMLGALAAAASTTSTSAA